MGSGLLEANRTGGTVKRVHCGWAAHAGVVAADLAAHGLTGPPTVIEGRFGFLHAFCGDRADVDAVTAGLGERWELPGIFFKPYPCNHFTHAGIDAALEMRARGVDPDDIVSIELGAPTAVLRTIAQPPEEKARPRSGYHAAFSGPYTVAAALVGGDGLGVFHDDFTDTAARDEQRLALAALVRCVPDARCDEIFPHHFTRRAAGHDHRRYPSRGSCRRQPRWARKPAHQRRARDQAAPQRLTGARRRRGCCRGRCRSRPAFCSRRQPADEPRRRGQSGGDAMTVGAGHVRRLEHLVEWGLGDDVLLGDDVPHVVTLVTDTIAAIVGASLEREVLALATAAPGLGGTGPATVLATGAGTTAATAALVNGTAAVRLELDEGNPHAANHPCAHTLPALLATAEAIGSDGPTLLAATAAAYEVAVRVARGARLRRSVHPFGTTMVCGAALGVARLRGLDVEQAARAVRLAAALVPASTQRAANTGATVRNAVTGVCASIGVLAVELALAGIGDDPLALPTVFGEVLGEGYDDSLLDAELGQVRLIRTGYLKTHASSRWTHAPIEATETLIARHGFGGPDVEAVEVATYDPATRLDGREARNGFAGKHSIPYSVAARVLLRDNGVDAYTDDAATDPGMRELMQRVSVVEDPAMTAAIPDVRSARVTVTLIDGRELRATETTPAGGSDNPYPADVIREKHRSLTRRALRDDAADELLQWCAALPAARDLGGLADIVSRRR